MDKFTNRVLKFIRDEELISPGDAVTVGFSGGADSMCLLKVLCSLKALLKIDILAVHVNHNLRGSEALRDESFCREEAGKMNAGFKAVSVDVTGYAGANGLTEEEAGRILRYEALQGEALAFAAEKGGCRALIAVAHHADDQAETILLNMLRGSGLKGLGGMRPKRDNIIRPLLCVSRQSITEELEKNGLGYVDDSTNFENDHTRNRLRNIILPELKEHINERAAEHIAASGAFALEADEYISAEASKYLDEIGAAGRTQKGSAEDGAECGSIRLCQTVLKEKKQIFRRYVIIEALRRLGVPLKDLGERHFADIDKALFGNGGYHVDLPGGVYVENTYRETVIHRH
ncbi:MAG: tRNA lysidine(34) synthetase TilS [Eubacteriales bacterium]|nr:tRNA lysidine(34) synthetase TilS [Eubacteriales bacterium]